MKCEVERQRVDNIIAAVSGAETEGIHKITEMPLVSVILQIYPAGMKLLQDAKVYKLELYKITSADETQIIFNTNEYIQTIWMLMDAVKIMIVKINLLP
jgi:hypothetical protein